MKIGRVGAGPRGDGTVQGAPNLPVDFDIAKDTVWKNENSGSGAMLLP